jgi:hypothetical protein
MVNRARFDQAMRRTNCTSGRARPAPIQDFAGQRLNAPDASHLPGFKPSIVGVECSRSAQSISNRAASNQTVANERGQSEIQLAENKADSEMIRMSKSSYINGTGFAS